MSRRPQTIKAVTVSGRSYLAVFALFGLLLGLALSYFSSSSKTYNIDPEETLQATQSDEVGSLSNEKGFPTQTISEQINESLRITAAEAAPIWEAYLQRYQTALALHATDPLSSLFTPVLDQAFLNPNGKSAVLWLALQDSNGYLLHTEPGLVLAEKSEAGWQIILPEDPRWQQALQAQEQSLIPAAYREAHTDSDQNEPNAPITGYHLPYAAGTSHKLEGSILHFHSYPPLGYPSCDQSYCRYAYDFTDVGHFPLLSARAGTVIASRDSCTDGNTGCTNYIVIQDAQGGAYQLYLHLAHNTIPDHLSNGSYIGRGFYIGDTDDTGYSTSEHVHFMVVSNFWYAGDGHPWGRSLDIRFDDVPINAGIPRTCYEVSHLSIYDNALECMGSKADPFNPNNDWYPSGNVGAAPPSGSLTRPAEGATVLPGESPILDVSAQTQDDVGVVKAVLLARINGSWKEIGPRVTNPSNAGIFDWDVDLCQVGPLNGPLEIALKLWDHEGNMVDLLSRRTINIAHACPPPVSQLTAPTTYDGTAMKLNWTAGAAGVALSKFELQWREAGSAWSTQKMLTLPPSSRSAWFIGVPGGRFEFRLRAIDANGQTEVWPSNDAAELSHSFPANCQMDGWEPNGSIPEARTVSFGNQIQGNLCPSADVDWYRVETGGYSRLDIQALSLNGGSAVKVSVYNESGELLLKNASANALGAPLYLQAEFSENQSLLIKVEPAFPNLSGTEVQYGLTLIGVEPFYLPIIYR